MQSLVVIDRDRSDTDFAADLAGLPAPTYVASNPHTGTGQDTRPRRPLLPNAQTLAELVDDVTNFEGVLTSGIVAV